MKTKRQYVKPVANIHLIQIECCISNASTTDISMNENMRIFEQWEEDVQQNEYTIDW